VSEGEVGKVLRTNTAKLTETDSLTESPSSVETTNRDKLPRSTVSTKNVKQNMATHQYGRRVVKSSISSH
jgi:hypothetical protein